MSDHEIMLLLFCVKLLFVVVVIFVADLFINFYILLIYLFLIHTRGPALVILEGMLVVLVIDNCFILLLIKYSSLTIITKF